MAASFSEPYAYETGYVAQHLGGPGALPPVIHLAGVEYRVKPELHCSLVAVKNITPVLIQRGLMPVEEVEQRVTEIIASLITKHQPHLQQYLPEIRVAVKPEESKQSLIIMVRVNNLEEFYAELSATLQLEVPVQTPHVTLYTLPNGLGIGVNGQTQLEERTRPLTDAESLEWHEQIDMKKLFGVTRG